MKLLTEHRQYFFLVLGILLVATFLRFWQLATVPVGPYWDEVAMMVDVKTILATGKDMHGNYWLQTMFPSYGDFKLPVYIWFATISSFLFGNTLWSIRFVSALAGVLQVGLLIWAVPKLFRQWSDNKDNYEVIGLVSGIILAMTPWSILFSRTGFEGHLGQLILSLSIFLLILYPKSKSITMIGVLLGALSVYTYYSLRFVWPVVFVTVQLIHFYEALPELLPKKKFINILKIIYPACLGLLLWAILLLPLRLSPYYGPSQQFRLSADSILNPDERVIETNTYREIDNNSLTSRLFFHRYLFLIHDLANQYAQFLDINYLFIDGDPQLRHGTQRGGLFLLPFLPFLFIGLYQLWQQKKPQFILLLVWWMIALLPAAIPVEVPHALRSINALTPLTLIISYGIWSLWLKIKPSNVLHVAGVALFILIYSFFTLFWFVDYFYLYSMRSADDWQSGYTELVPKVAALNNQSTPIVMDIGDGRWYLWYLSFSDISPQEIQSLPYDRHVPINIQDMILSPSQMPPDLTQWTAVQKAPANINPAQEGVVFDSLNRPVFEILQKEKMNNEIISK